MTQLQIVTLLTQGVLVLVILTVAALIVGVAVRWVKHPDAWAEAAEADRRFNESRGL